MNRLDVAVVVAALAVLGSAASLGCSRAPDVVSPYSNPTATLPRGFVGAVRIDLASSTLSRVLGLETGDPAVLHVFVLDPDVAGGGEAAVLSGTGAEELEGMLIDGGMLSKSSQDGCYYLGSDAHDGSTSTPPSGGGALGALSFLSSGRLQRFEIDERIVFAPTIDLRQDLASLDDAATKEIGDNGEIAVAFDGKSLARVLRQREKELFGPLGEMGIDPSGSHRGARRVTSAIHGVLELIEGIRLLQGTYGQAGASGRLHVQEGSSLAKFTHAMKPFDGDWPLVDEGGLKIAFACDPALLESAMAMFVSDGDESADHLLPEWWDGRLAATFELDRMELSRLALGVRPEATPNAQDLQILPSAYSDELRGATLAHGWFTRHADNERIGPLGAPPGVFGLVRDGKTPVENARVILRLTQEAGGVVAVSWLGLQGP